MTYDMKAETISITGHGGDPIEAYLAQPLGAGPYGGVVVIHHMPGYDEGTKEITRRFAAKGYIALMPNLYWREAPGAAPDDAAAAARAQGGVPDERLVGDVQGAADHIQSLPGANGKVGTIGYCSGGRQSFLAACSLPLDAAVACYPGMVVKPPSPSRSAPSSTWPKISTAPCWACSAKRTRTPRPRTWR
jgi:carboxymethylenebutenolidase